MNKEKILEILKDQAFATKILEMQTPEQVQAAFKEKGVEISVDEVKVLGEIINKMVEKKTSKLSPADLEEIAGGFEISDLKEDLIGAGKGLATGAKAAITTPIKVASGGKFGDNKIYDEDDDDDNKITKGVGAAGVMVLGAAALVGVGAAGYKAVEWGIGKIRKKIK